MNRGWPGRKLDWRRLKAAAVLQLALWWSWGAAAEVRLPVDYSLRRWSATDQLPFSAVEAIRQTRDGFLWFAMNGGLGRFDGVSLEVFDSHNTAGLPVSYATSLAEADDGSLWVGTAGGGLLHLREGGLERFGEAQGLANEQVKALCFEPGGLLWIGTDGGGIFLRQPDGMFRQFGTNQGLPELFISALKQDERGRLVALTFHHGPYLLRGNRFEALPLVPAARDGVAFALTRSPGGRVWLGGASGVYRLEGEEFRRWAPADQITVGKPVTVWEVATNELWLGTEQGLVHWKEGAWAAYPTGGAVSARTVEGFTLDHEGSVWASTEGGGLVQLRPTPAATLGVGEGLPGSEVTSVLVSRDGGLWVGTSQGLARFEAAGSRRFTQADGLADDFIYSVQQDGRGDVWVATRSGLLLRWDGQRFAPPPVAIPGPRRSLWCLAPGAAGSLWIGSSRGALQFRDGQWVRSVAHAEGLSNDDVRAVLDEGNGTVWLGTSYGLNRLDSAGMTNFTKLPGLDPIEVVIALHRDRAGALWIGTMARGLFRLQDGKFTHYSAANGLPSNSINSISEDAAGDLWLGTGRGLVRLRRSELDAVAGGGAPGLTPLVLRRADGLRSEEFTGTIQPTCARDASGRLWFASGDGLTTVQPARIFQNDRPPKVSIERVAVEGADRGVRLTGQSLAAGREVALPAAAEFGNAPAPAGERRSVFSPRGVSVVRIPAGQDRLDFQFVGPSFIAPQAVTYRYRLEGFDRDWVEAGSRRAAYYTRVPPGRYVFRVQAGNEDGVRGEPGAALIVEVAPIWWQRTSTRVLSLMGLVGLGSLLYFVRVRQLDRRNEAAAEFSRQLLRSQEHERARLAGELHDGLGQELQLIRNRAELALRRHSPSAELTRELGSISETASRAIGGVRALSRGLRPPELDQLGLTEALRWLGQNVAEAFAGKLEFRVVPVDGLLPRPLEVNVYRIAQEALNNAVRHSGGSEITFEVELDGRTLVLSVFDNGRGLDSTDGADGSGGGSGLKTMRERAAMLHGELELLSEPSVGTRLTLRVPVPDNPVTTS